MNTQELHLIQDALSDRWTVRYLKYGSEIVLLSGAKISRTAIRPAASRGTLQQPVLEELAGHLGVPWDELVAAAKIYAAATALWGAQILRWTRAE